MIFGPIRVAAVDDDPAHLLAITSGLAASGIPCAGYWYDRGTGNLSPAPTGKLSSVRLIFMDLNLAEIAGGPPDTATLCGTVMEVLEQLLSKDAGPYLLVFWTNVSGRVKDVADMLYQRLEEAHGVPCPLAIEQIAKGPFIVNDPKEKDFGTALLKFHADLHAKLPALAAAVSEAISKEPQLNLLCAWESRATAAAAGAVNEVFYCAKGDAAPVERSDVVKLIAAKIAIAASGEESARRAPARALDAGMVDILIDQFGASVDDAAYTGVVHVSLSTTLKEKTVKCNNDAKVSAALNTFFHVDSDVATTSAAERGVVVSGKAFNKSELGFALNEQLSDFLIAWESFPAEQQLEARTLWEAFKRPEFVLVELGADCDHAQDTARTRRFLLGLEVPKRFTKLPRFPGNGKLRNGALELLGPWTLEGEERWLLVSCKRFWIWQERKPHTKSKVKYRLRAPIVEKLLHQYASWHSRPGVVEFNPSSSPTTGLYFAYGSNLYSERLRQVAPSAIKTKTAKLRGYLLAFDKVSTDGSGKCHIRKTDQAEDVVYGALYLLEAHDLAALTRHEGGYSRIDVVVTTANGDCAAVTYIADTTDAALKPFDWYVGYIVAGAEEHGLPSEYVAQIRATATKDDENPERSEKHKSALVKAQPSATT